MRCLERRVICASWMSISTPNMDESPTSATVLSDDDCRITRRCILPSAASWRSEALSFLAAMVRVEATAQRPTLRNPPILLHLFWASSSLVCPLRVPSCEELTCITVCMISSVTPCLQRVTKLMSRLRTTYMASYNSCSGTPICGSECISEAPALGLSFLSCSRM